jgi:hypothetical protein
LIRLSALLPAIGSHRSRGNDSRAADLDSGSTRITMMVSLRSPIDSRSPNAPANGESGAMQALLSAPVIRMFNAPGSAMGNVSTGPVSTVAAPMGALGSAGCTAGVRPSSAGAMSWVGSATRGMVLP